MTYSQAQSETQARNAEILQRLRAYFGEERDNELADIDGLSLLSLFLHPLPQPKQTDAGQDEDDSADAGLTRGDLAELRRQRRLRRHESTSTYHLPIPPEAHQGSAGYAEFLEQLPQLREYFGAWLASVDADFVPSSSSLDELKTLKTKAEQRLRLLNTMTAETQRELDSSSSTFVRWKRSNAIEPHLRALLRHLATQHPDQGWYWFLTEGGDIQ